MCVVKRFSRRRRERINRWRVPFNIYMTLPINAFWTHQTVQKYKRNFISIEQSKRLITQLFHQHFISLNKICYQLHRVQIAAAGTWPHMSASSYCVRATWPLLVLRKCPSPSFGFSQFLTRPNVTQNHFPPEPATTLIFVSVCRPSFASKLLFPACSL